MAFATGSTERAQLTRLLNESIANECYNFTQKNESPRHFTVENVTTHNCCTIIRIIEIRSQIFGANKSSLPASDGGSSFLSVAINERRLYSCPFIDYFNGTYDVVCRLYDECHNISITLTYINYNAFRWDSKLVTKQLFLKRVCRQSCKTANFGPYIGWYRNNRSTTWRWLRGDREVMTDNQMRTCIVQLPSPVLLFGDSHLRYTLYYWLSLINKLSRSMAFRKFGGEITVDKFTMKFVSFTLNQSDIANIE